MNKFSVLAIAILALAMFAGTASAETELNDHSERGLYTIISGNVTDENNEPVSGLPVRVFCQHGTRTNELTTPNLKTNMDGEFYVASFNLLPRRRCVEGDMAWFTVEYNGQTFTSEKVEVDKVRTTHRPFYNYNWADTSKSVPEFSTVTMGAAIAGVMLGLVFLRKNQ